MPQDVPTNAVTTRVIDPLRGRSARSTEITLPRGLLGFEECKRFVLEQNAEWSPLAKLRSLDEPRLSFVVAPPRAVAPDYHLSLESYEIAELNVRDRADVDVWVIVSVASDPCDVSVNLQGPLIVNRENGLGKQLVLVRSRYTTRHPIFSQTAESSVAQGVAR